jgi:putative transposase
VSAENCAFGATKTAATPRTLVPYLTCRIHIVWCPKYRRKVLVGDVEQRLKHILYAAAQQYGVLIETMEVRPDHVHLLVSSDPTRCVAEIVNRLKGASSRILRGEFPHLKSRLPTLWSRSYYAGTVGHVSEATLKKYIENQKGR